MPEKWTKRLKELEKLSQALEPTAKQRDHWLAILQQYTNDFYQSLPDRPTYQPTTHIDEHITNLDSTGNLQVLLDAFHQTIVNQGLDTTSSRQLGFIPGGGIFPSALGDYLAALVNTYAASTIASPGAVAMEKALIAWLTHLFGFPKNSTGNLTSGGSIANMIALVTARDAHNIHADTIPKSVIYLSHVTHHSVTKCLRIIGLIDAIIRVIPTDSHYTIDTEYLRKTIAHDKKSGLKPWIIIGNAGTTDVGSIDPLDTLSAIAKTHKMWLHVDAAYGGFFILTPQGKNAFKGIDLADSIVVDPHKGLFISYGLGAVIIRHPSAHLHAFAFDAPYMQDVKTNELDWSPYDVSPELTKHFRAVRLWLSLKLYGTEPFAACLEEKIILARYFYEAISQIPHIDIACQPELSIVVFRFQPPHHDGDHLTKQIHDYLCHDGHVFLSSTRLDGKYYLRMACLSFRTHRHEIDLTLNLLKQSIQQCTADIVTSPS